MSEEDSEFSCLILKFLKPGEYKAGDVEKSVENIGVVLKWEVRAEKVHILVIVLGLKATGREETKPLTDWDHDEEMTEEKTLEITTKALAGRGVKTVQETESMVEIHVCVEENKERSDVRKSLQKSFNK